MKLCPPNEKKGCLKTKKSPRIGTNVPVLEVLWLSSDVNYFLQYNEKECATPLGYWAVNRRDASQRGADHEVHTAPATMLGSSSYFKEFRSIVLFCVTVLSISLGRVGCLPLNNCEESLRRNTMRPCVHVSNDRKRQFPCHNCTAVQHGVASFVTEPISLMVDLILYFLTRLVTWAKLYSRSLCVFLAALTDGPKGMEIRTQSSSNIH
jgi:hypothetical protein